MLLCLTLTRQWHSRRMRAFWLHAGLLEGAVQSSFWKRRSTLVYSLHFTRGDTEATLRHRTCVDSETGWESRQEPIYHVVVMAVTESNIQEVMT